MSTAASGVLDYLMGTTFPTALSSYTDDQGNGATIYFGPGVERFTAPVTVQCHGIKFEDQWMAISPDHNYEEEATLPCTLTSWNPGDGSSQGYLDRKTEVFNALVLISSNLAQDATLGGLVRWLKLSQGQMVPGKPLGGSIAHLDFELAYAVRVFSLTLANVY